MLIIIAESRHRRCKLLRHPANAGFKVTPVWQELGRDPNERGPEVIQYNGLEKSTVADPLIGRRLSDGRFVYLSDRAVVILDRSGTVVTIYMERQFDTKKIDKYLNMYLKKEKMINDQ
jgi:hypothetical protein